MNLRHCKRCTMCVVRKARGNKMGKHRVEPLSSMMRSGCTMRIVLVVCSDGELHRD